MAGKCAALGNPLSFLRRPSPTPCSGDPGGLRQSLRHLLPAHKPSWSACPRLSRSLQAWGPDCQPVTVGPPAAAPCGERSKVKFSSKPHPSPCSSPPDQCRIGNPSPRISSVQPSRCCPPTTPPAPLNLARHVRFCGPHSAPASQEPRSALLTPPARTSFIQ